MEKYRLPAAMYEWALAKMALKKAGATGWNRIDSAVSKQELLSLFKLARQCPKGALALEIGSYYGKSSCFLAAGLAANGGQLVCVDTWNNDWLPTQNLDIFEEFRRVTGRIANLTPLRKRSEAIVAADFARPLDLVFIDGDHSYEGTRKDFETVLPLVAPRATIVFHDVTAFAGVSRAVGEALLDGRWALGGLTRSLGWIVPADFYKDWK